MAGPGILPIMQKLVANAQTAGGSFMVPPNSAIANIYVDGLNANAVTGGVKFGTTAGGVDIVAALAVAGNSVNQVASASILKRSFSKTQPQQIFWDAVTLFNGASLDVTITYENLNNG